VTAYVSLLRGINLGPTTQVSMHDLKQVYVDLGLDAVTTYIRSGNVVFRSRAKPETVRSRIETAITRELRMDIDVLIRTHDEVTDVLARNPFPDADPARLAVAFLGAAVPDDLAERLGSADFGSDRYAAHGREIYLHLPNGFGRSKLGTRVSTLKAPVVATVRNWRTVTKLADMSGPGG
jgi:uncharacterized protein (DUF1697 family)